MLKYFSPALQPASLPREQAAHNPSQVDGFAPVASPCSPPAPPPGLAGNLTLQKPPGMSREEWRHPPKTAAPRQPRKSLSATEKSRAHERLIAQIKEQQTKASSPENEAPEPLPAQPATAQSLFARLSGHAYELVQRLPVPGLLPVAAAAQPPQKSSPAQSEPVVLGQNGFLIAEFDFRNSFSAQEKEKEAGTHRDIVKPLAKLAGKAAVHVVPNPQNNAPFLRNILAEGPNSMITGQAYAERPRDQVMIDAVRQHLKKAGIKNKRLNHVVNFANVDFMPKGDLLVLANYGPVGVISPAAKKDLVRVFGHPKNVVHLELNWYLKNSRGADLCYDLDLAFHAMTNARGEKIALIHKPCLALAAESGQSNPGPEAVVKTFEALGFKVIEISQRDQENLALNGLSLDDDSGRLLLPSKNVSSQLQKQLMQHHIEPLFSSKKKVLGHAATDDIPPYGLHCFAVSLRRPEKQIEQKTEL